MQERTTFYPDGTLDEVVAEGGVHIERLDKKSWFISCQRKDGSEFCLWMDGVVRMTEEREARPSGGDVHAQNLPDNPGIK